MAIKPTLQLPDLPADWYQDAIVAPASGKALEQGPGILDGLPTPREWTLADSGLNIVMSPERCPANVSAGPERARLYASAGGCRRTGAGHLCGRQQHTPGHGCAGVA
jgi:hypothetical protein